MDNFNNSDKSTSIKITQLTSNKDTDSVQFESETLDPH